MTRRLPLLFNDDVSEQSEILVVAGAHNFPLQHVVTSDGHVFYAVQDWIAGVAKTGQPSDFWQALKKRTRKMGIELSTSCRQLPYLASNGREYKMDYADGETLYLITQHMGVDTGIRNEVLAYLAKTGAFVDRVRSTLASQSETPKLPARAKRLMAAKVDQGYSDDEAKTFLQLVHEGIPARKDLTAVLKLVVCGAINYGQATDTEYRAIFNMTARQIKALTGFKVARDALTPAGRAIVTAAEVSVEAALNQRINLTFQEALHITEQVCLAYGGTVKNLEAVMGVSLVTGKPLLVAHK